MPDPQFLLARVQELRVPDAPRRRRGTDSAFRSALSEVQAELADICRHETVAGPQVDESDDELRYVRVDLPIELASLLFAAGAAHSEWRWWASRAANALLEEGDAQSACVWAVVAHDDSLIGRMPEASEPGTQPGHVVWWLASSPRRVPSRTSAAPHPGRAPDESVDAAWAALVDSIPARDHVATGRALRTITDFWLDEDEDWEEFHPHSYPDFEPELNAVAALARRSGWEPAQWPPDAVRFLEAGLAPESPH